MNQLTMQYCLNEYNRSNFFDFFSDSDSEHFEFPWVYILIFCVLCLIQFPPSFAWLSISHIPTNDTNMTKMND